MSLLIKIIKSFTALYKGSHYREAEEILLKLLDKQTWDTFSLDEKTNIRTAINRAWADKFNPHEAAVMALLSLYTTPMEDDDDLLDGERDEYIKQKEANYLRLKNISPISPRDIRSRIWRRRNEGEINGQVFSKAEEEIGSIIIWMEKMNRQQKK